jgi:hypothetical protein
MTESLLREQISHLEDALQNCTANLRAAEAREKEFEGQRDSALKHAHKLADAVVAAEAKMKGEPVAWLHVSNSAVCNGRKVGHIRGFEDFVRKMPIGEHALYTAPLAVTDAVVETALAAYDGQREANHNAELDDFRPAMRKALEAAIKEASR